MLTSFRPIILSSLAVVALAGAALVAAPALAAGASKSLVVATNGNDSAAGTLAAPLRTVQAAVTRLSGGGTIDIRGGRYFQKVDLAGSSGITVEAYKHEHVILDGSRFTPEGLVIGGPAESPLEPAD